MPDHHFHQVGCRDDDVVPSEMGLRRPSYLYCSSVLDDDSGILTRNTHYHPGISGRLQGRLRLQGLSMHTTQLDKEELVIFWTWHLSFLPQ